MKISSLPLLLVCLCLSLTACKKPAATTEAAPAPATTAPAAAPAAPVAAAEPAADPDVPKAPAHYVNPPFDFNTIAESTATVPPFPYIAYPPTVGPAFQGTTTSPMDEVYIILGKNLHRIEGRTETHTFYNSDAKMSELEIRRNYENAIKALGAVKVNTVGADDKALIAAVGDELKLRDKLRLNENTQSYDAYLVRKGPQRRWIMLMMNDRTTVVLSVEEKDFVQTVGYVAAGGKTTPVTATGTPAVAAQPVDLEAVPVTTTALPPFPFVAYPPTVGQAFQSTTSSNFDAVSVIVGKQLMALEGKVETRTFSNRDADMSEMALRRNYEAAVKGLGGVKVNSVAPETAALIAANGDEYVMREKKLRIPERHMTYDSYLIRTPEKRVWIVLMFNDRRTAIVTVEEKAFVQSVALVTADTMRSELAAKGHVALYVNFDTDKATIRSDGKPAVDEIVTLLKKDAALKLTIEGHTDNVGDAAHNKDLSQRRADAVMAQLVAAGVAKTRLAASGIGDARPVADNKDEQGRAKNRRVELVSAAK